MSGLTAVSLFAGIGGFDLALERSGVTVTAAVEINAEARSRLARHFPRTTLFNDVTEVSGDQLRATGFVPERGILTGGFPCQDLSIAGRRAGLGGARSGLFWHIMRLADELRPRWLLLENVPGLLSAVCSCPGEGVCVTNGRAGECGEWRLVPAGRGVLGYLRWRRNGRKLFEFHPNVPHGVKGGACAGGCMRAHGGAMGTVLGAVGSRGYGFSYRVLDAQFFGVPQRRRRVFIAGCLGDWAAPVQVLLEPESGQGNPAAGRAAGTGTAGAPGGGAVATLQGGGRRGHRVDAEGAAGGHLVAHALTAREGKGPDSDAVSGFIVAPTLTAGWGTNHGSPGNGGKDDAALAVIAATIRSHPRPHSHGPGTVIPVAMRGRDAGAQVEAGEPGDPAFTVRTPGGGSSYPMVAHSLTAGTATGEGVSAPGRRREDDINLVTHALTSEGADASEDGTGRGTPLVTVPMAFNPQTGGSKARIGYSETPTALHSSQITAVQTAAAVRRLTPMECERLQGFPDRWTEDQSDSTRYRQLGNAVAVPVVEWISRRVVAVEAEARHITEGAA